VEKKRNKKILNFKYKLNQEFFDKEENKEYLKLLEIKYKILEYSKTKIAIMPKICQNTKI
jgi:hypothetical protein